MYLSFCIDCDGFGRGGISLFYFACPVVKHSPGIELVSKGMNEFQS